MHFPQRARALRHKPNGNCLGDGENAAVGNPDLSALRLPYGLSRPEGKGERGRGQAKWLSNGLLVPGQITGQLALEDPEIVKRNLRECPGRNLPANFSLYHVIKF